MPGCRAVANGEDGFFCCRRVRGGVAEDNWLEGNGGPGMAIGHKDSDNFVRRNTIIGNQRGGVYWRAALGMGSAALAGFAAGVSGADEPRSAKAFPPEAPRPAKGLRMATYQLPA